VTTPRVKAARELIARLGYSDPKYGLHPISTPKVAGCTCRNCRNQPDPPLQKPQGTPPMKNLLLATVAALSLASGIALAQTTTAPTGQTAGGAINQNVMNNNSDAMGFSQASLTPALVVPATSTAQATWTNGAVTGGTMITTKTTMITTCSGTTGVTLPAVQRFEPITIINRSGGSCLVWPSIGATVETALGTDGAANAPFTMLTNTDITFRPITGTRWLQ
jgi:hypothetical protein